MKATDIEWTTFSSNPLKYRDSAGNIVWACVKCSPGCTHCYAERLTLRYGKGKAFTLPNIDDVTPFVCQNEIKKVITAKTVDKIPTQYGRVFLGDMTDIFGEWVPFDLIDEILPAIALRQDMIFQILTKRPWRAATYFNNLTFDRVDAACRKIGYTIEFNERPFIPFPLRNLHIGTSVENQKAAGRLWDLLAINGYMTFASVEPLISDVDLRRVQGIDGSPYELDALRGQVRGTITRDIRQSNKLGWVIVGGESGDKARPMHPQHAMSLRDQCVAAEVPFFFKQWGEWCGGMDFYAEADESGPAGIYANLHNNTVVRENSFKDSEWKNWSHDEDLSSVNDYVSVRVGKKKAGRMLDSREWSQFPKTSQQEARK